MPNPTPNPAKRHTARTARKRNRTSAKTAGTRFERQIADYLKNTWDDRIDRKARTGAKDTGDIANFRTPNNRRITVECKNTTRLALPQWWREATTQQHNAGDDNAIIIHKRHGDGDPANQWVTLTLAQLLTLMEDK